MDELISRRDEGRRLLVATRGFQVSVLAILLANLAGAIEGASIAGLMDADGEFPDWIGWVTTPRRALSALGGAAVLVGIIVVARTVALRLFSFWGVLFAVDGFIMVAWKTTDLVETVSRALTGALPWPLTWLSFVHGWFWPIMDVAVPIAAAVCALRLNRRWDGALCSPIRVRLLAVSAILIFTGFEVSSSIHDALEWEAATSFSVMAPMAAILLLAMAWQIWLLIELQRAARRLKRSSH